MFKKRFLLLIILSALSVLILIFLQVYWVKKNVETQQEQFNQNVMQVMQNVVKTLDREVAVTKITSSLLNGEELFEGLRSDSTLSVNNAKSDSNYKLSYPVTSKIPSDELQIGFKPPPQNDSSFFIIRETSKRILSSSVSSSYASDTLLTNQLKKKATLVNDLVNELALISINKNKREDISYEKIDSIFKIELVKSGIKSNYVFDILDVESNLLTFTEEGGENGEIQETPFRISLFPNNYLLESDILLLYFPDKNSFILEHSWQILLMSFLLVCIIISLFYTSIATIYKQKKLSSVKNDFINNMTHELKTPISTISLACEALGDNNLKLDEERRGSYVHMIKDENKRLSVLVDNVLKSAVWDSTKLILNYKNVNLHDLIRKVANSFDIQIEKKNGQMKLNLQSKNAIIHADPVHFSNVIYNLLDNANKYTPVKPCIEVSTKDEQGFTIISVTDNGIGLTKDSQKRIFDKFYRVSTGNIHDVKGFGLGLSYVKRIVELHSGEISINSTKGQGTTINIKLAGDGK